MTMLRLLLVVGVTYAAGSADLEMKERPVARVVRLLKDMQGQLEKERAQDEELYEKLTCWCSTNKEDKTKAVATAQTRITNLGAKIGSLAAKGAELQVSIEQLAKELASYTKALAEATSLREKESAEFISTEKDLLQSIQSVQTAIQVLSKHHESFLQTGSAKAVQESLRKVLAAKALDAKARKTLKALLEQPAGAGESYAPQSGVIFGTLKTMKETFETNLEDARSNENKAQSDFAQVKATKTAQITEATTLKEQKEEELAATDSALADAKVDLTETREALASDRKFLSDLNLRCQATDHENAQRSKVRADEIAAVGEAIQILSDDDAHDLFSRSTSFLQTSKARKVRLAAASVLAKAGAATSSTELVALASQVKIDSFVAVKKAIDDMVAALKKTMADDVTSRDTCVDEFSLNDRQTAQKQRELDNLKVDIESMTATIDRLAKELADLAAQVAEMQKQMLVAGADREESNHDFQTTIADQRATQAVLKKAKARLNVFYGSLLQQEPGADVAPPPGEFRELKSNKGAGGVLQLLTNIIEESHETEMDAIQAEADEQKAYEEFIANSNESVSNAQTAITNKKEESAKTDGDKVSAGADQAAALGDAESLANVKADLHKSCDFLMRNFEARQEAMSQEIDALGEAKSILSGAN